MPRRPDVGYFNIAIVIQPDHDISTTSLISDVAISMPFGSGMLRRPDVGQFNVPIIIQPDQFSTTLMLPSACPLALACWEGLI
jgi:hypothetical protein